MQTATAPKPPYKPRVRRMSHRELQDTHISDDFNASSQSTNRWSNRTQSHAPPETINPWKPMDQPPRNPANDNENKCFMHRGWFWFFGGVFCLILIIAIIAIVLGIVLPMTTSAPNSNATPTVTCSSIDRGSIARLDETNSSDWISYSYNYSATKTTPTILFGFETQGSRAYYLDTVSVVDVNAPTIELLTDPSFENSTVNGSNWIQSCQTMCERQFISGSQCFQSSGNCFMVNCPGDNSSISFLSQSFLATIGNTYTISFMLNHQSNSSAGIMTLYIDII